MNSQMKVRRERSGRVPSVGAPVPVESGWSHLLCTDVFTKPEASLVLLFLPKFHYGDFPGGSVVKTLPVNAGVTSSIPGLGRSHVPRSN